MPAIEIKHLLNNRLSDNDISLLLCVLYIPLGIIILSLRAILLLGLFLLAQILPDTKNVRKFISKLACLAVGITLQVENCKTKEAVNVYISNNLSIFDQLIISTATGSISPSARTTLERVLGLSSYCFTNIGNLDKFKSNVNKFIVENQTPLYFAPEGRPTNGKGLLKFKIYPFEFTSKIQPVCISIERPYLDISVTSIGSSYLSDILYFMFCPTTNYKLMFLPPIEKHDQTDEEFADVVRRQIANALKIEPTNYTSTDLAEWEKRKLAEDQVRAQGRNTTRAFNPEIQRMTVQVKEVLPHVPFNVIYIDLCEYRKLQVIPKFSS
ncbi:unnamed protein product [Phaedon cochleariae]|uniref:Uncharacterized protein n=1 Tax=Phaedon cochleariae TaxID=80249 RepID=A0A9N9SDY1_PHACE|nr:unnamed protein product [Phaedon cochleariae]